MPKYIFAGGAFRLVPDDTPPVTTRPVGRNRQFTIRRNTAKLTVARNTTNMRVR